MGFVMLRSQSDDASAILSSIEITCLWGQSCSAIITVQYNSMQDDLLGDENRIMHNSPYESQLQNNLVSAFKPSSVVGLSLEEEVRMVRRDDFASCC
jgi:hypothetical protein